MKYLVSLIIIILGVFITIKSEWMLKVFGYNAFAERKFAMWGGSRTFYKLFGIVIVFLSLMYVTGWLQDILLSIFSPVRNIA